MLQIDSHRVSVYSEGASQNLCIVLPRLRDHAPAYPSTSASKPLIDADDLDTRHAVPTAVLRTHWGKISAG